MVSVIEIGEVKKEPHVKRLADGTEFLHERMIETSEVTLLQRCNNGTPKRYGARFDRITRMFRALKINLRENIEGMLGETAVVRFEICRDEGVMDFA